MHQRIFVFLLTLTCHALFFATTVNASNSPKRHWKTHSERKAFRKARNYSLHGEQLKARQQYEILVGIDSTNFLYNYELGMSYYFAYESGPKTVQYLESALHHSHKDTIGELFYYLADACHNANRFQDAINYFHRFEGYIMDGSASDNLRNEIADQIKQCELGLNLWAELTNGKTHSGKSKEIENIGPNVNTVNSEYAPVVNESDSVMMFTARNASVTGSKIDHWDEKYFEDMFISVKSGGVFNKPENFSGNNKYVALVPNTRKHDAVVSLSLDEKQFITYRDNKLWISKLEDGKWTGPDLLPDNINVGTYQPHATLSYDGKTIYFTSDKPGGFGGLDIYKCIKKDNGDWSDPENMGPTVNTAKDEDSPQISYNSRTLYFSSKGHNSIGGYDIFQTTFDPYASKWSDAENMGMPLNSGGDDIFYKPNRAGTMAYFASFRPEGYGDMDIYIYHLPKNAVFEPCYTMADLQRMKWPVSFTILSADSFLVNETAEFDAANFSSGAFDLISYSWKIDTFLVRDSAGIHYKFPSAGKYQVKLSLLGMNKVTEETSEFCISKEIRIKDKDIQVVISGTLNKDSLKNYNQNNLPDLGLQKVYYDFDKFGLRKDARETLDRNIEILKQHPEVIIKVLGNTDSRGSNTYNKILSERRARYVVEYMEKHGVSKSRIVAVISNGEDDLINKCGDGENCSNYDHSLNRRTEFTVVATK
jgi:outer membrane protein OmpA-like peptidoglycan-associated protein